MSVFSRGDEGIVQAYGSINGNSLKDRLTEDIHKGLVFPALRNNGIAFYYKCKRIFLFDGTEFRTNIKYALVVPDSLPSAYVAEGDMKKLSLCSDFASAYEDIKKLCDRYVSKEDDCVAKLMRATTPFSKRSNKDIFAVDCEVAFSREVPTNDGVDYDDEPRTGQDRIDVLLYDSVTRQLLFLEIKRLHDSRVRASGEALPEVVSQMERYDGSISSRKNEIMEAYFEYSKNMSFIFPQWPVGELQINDIKLALVISDFDSSHLQDDRQRIHIDKCKGDAWSVGSIGDIKGITIPGTIRKWFS